MASTDTTKPGLDESADRPEDATVDERAPFEAVENDDDDDLDLDDDPLVEDTDVAPPTGATPRRSVGRRALYALLGTLAFEVLYAIGIGLVAFFSAGFVAVGPTLQSAAATPFAWVPAVCFLVCSFALALVDRGGRRALIIGTLVAAVVVYLGSTLVVLLIAGGSAALGVYTQELGVYPFFLTGIIAREVMFWTNAGRPRA